MLHILIFFLHIWLVFFFIILPLWAFSESIGAIAGQTVYSPIDHCTVVCSLSWPLNGSKAGGDLVLIKTSLFLSCKSSCSDAN